MPGPERGRAHHAERVPVHVRYEEQRQSEVDPQPRHRSVERGGRSGPPTAALVFSRAEQEQRRKWFTGVCEGQCQSEVDPQPWHRGLGAEKESCKKWTPNRGTGLLEQSINYSLELEREAPKSRQYIIYYRERLVGWCRGAWKARAVIPVASAGVGRFVLVL